MTWSRKSSHSQRRCQRDSTEHTRSPERGRDGVYYTCNQVWRQANDAVLIRVTNSDSHRVVCGVSALHVARLVAVGRSTSRTPTALLREERFFFNRNFFLSHPFPSPHQQQQQQQQYIFPPRHHRPMQDRPMLNIRHHLLPFVALLVKRTGLADGTACIAAGSRCGICTPTELLRSNLVRPGGNDSSSCSAGICD
jgi:hypothetical protein